MLSRRPLKVRSQWKLNYFCCARRTFDCMRRSIPAFPLKCDIKKKSNVHQKMHRHANTFTCLLSAKINEVIILHRQKCLYKICILPVNGWFFVCSKYFQCFVLLFLSPLFAFESAKNEYRNQFSTKS